MEENELIVKTEKSFEDIKHIDENGNEFWYARELMVSLGYKDWRNFSNVINKAKDACTNSNINVFEHFVDVNRVLKVGNNADMSIEDISLTRYACYLIAQNGSSKKKQIALAQTYFAVKTRQQELTEEEYIKLSEDDRRIYDRNLARKRNSALAEIAQKKGVENFGKFHNAGYLGLYNETAQQIKSRKKLSKKDDILDFMGSEELGANIFRITQTEAKLKKANINNEQLACATHNYVGKAVRRTIKQLGGTMPEDLPTPEKSVKQLEKERKKKNTLAQKDTKKLDK
ncbi:MAG: DNA damage-inducible protein D [Clostridia bacterium]|jgi:DNA-damage-inducible protein D|nr:DNA damage-inducible protein D [Clostridia bacterium]DAN11976.1 MAG TPA: DNA-damage-inducible protein D [Caudoviricetes sp.]